METYFFQPVHVQYVLEVAKQLICAAVGLVDVEVLIVMRVKVAICDICKVFKIKS